MGTVKLYRKIPGDGYQLAEDPLPGINHFGSYPTREPGEANHASGRRIEPRHGNLDGIPFSSAVTSSVNRVSCFIEK
jgi:hypothetical protein